MDHPMTDDRFLAALMGLNAIDTKLAEQIDRIIAHLDKANAELAVARLQAAHLERRITTLESKVYVLEGGPQP